MITCTYVTITCVIRICFVMNMKVCSTSESRSIIMLIVYRVCWLLQNKLVIMSKRKYERPFWIINCILPALVSNPFQRSKSSNFISKLSPNNCKSIWYFTTLLMELFCTKTIVAGSVKEFSRIYNSILKEIFNIDFLLRLSNDLRLSEYLSLISYALGYGLSNELIKLCS